MNIVRNKKALAEAIRGLRGQGKTIGLVPTMGALHAGHISLVQIALKHASAAVATIFINPTQFGPNEDFAKYPRTEEEDIEKLRNAGTHLIYIPTVEEMYPEGAVTRVIVPGISSDLEGAFRPGFFDGVATVVTKLFMQMTPDIAVFGEKDYQQLHIIRQMTRDLDLPIEIYGGPTLRETDGLAMASRNRYLNEKERKIAPALHQILKEVADKLRKKHPITSSLAEAKQALLLAGFTKVDYIELRDAATLAPLTEIKNPARLLAAAHIGTTRLIDNIGITS
jgi:pantoate--beta-alanine ligase